MYIKIQTDECTSKSRWMNVHQNPDGWMYIKIEMDECTSKSRWMNVHQNPEGWMYIKIQTDECTSKSIWMNVHQNPVGWMYVILLKSKQRFVESCKTFSRSHYRVILSQYPDLLQSYSLHFFISTEAATGGVL